VIIDVVKPSGGEVTVTSGGTASAVTRAAACIESGSPSPASAKPRTAAAVNHARAVREDRIDLASNKARRSRNTKRCEERCGGSTGTADTSKPPTERTEVRLLHDEDALYIGVMSFDSEPDKIIGTEMSRDGALRSEDRVGILLDTYGDQRNAFYFATNPSGALVDGLVFAIGQSNREWDAIWEVRTRRTAQGGAPSSRFPSRA
jgi:hypothetical protein